MQIHWSDEDQVYIVTLPEFHGCKTHGETYAKAARMGEEVIESLIAIYEGERKELPVPDLYRAAEAQKSLGVSLEGRISE